MFDKDCNHDAVKAVNRLLSRYAPEEAALLEAPIQRLFTALQNGHSFIWLNENEATLLDSCHKTVGHHGNTPLVLQGTKLFLGKVWQQESELAAEIMRLARADQPEIDFMQTAYSLNEWFVGKGSEGQRDAAALALLQNFMIITGGPGTGKTTTVAKLLGLICINSSKLPRIALAAPTGKAAAHMARALHRAIDGFSLPNHIRQHLLQLEGQTVHRLLKLMPPQMKAAYDHNRPLPADILIVDEASMLDTALMLQLLRAIPDGCRLILLGDENQLPSVGAGAVLSALSHHRPTVLDENTKQRLNTYLPQHRFSSAAHPPVLSQNIAHLCYSHRFGSDSGIGCLADKVVNGNSDAAWQQFERFKQDLEIREGGLSHKIALLYQKQQNYWAAVREGKLEEAYKRIGDIVVLSAWRQDAEELNQAYINYVRQKHGNESSSPWFEGLVLMIQRNDYTLNLFNGDIGLVMKDETGNLAAFFPDATGFRKIALSRLPDCDAAFAMTVHKSQGSEYSEVWLLPPSRQMANDEDILSGLNNALLYTGITRAKERFVFWGNREEWTLAVETVKKRHTALAELLRKMQQSEQTEA